MALSGADPICKSQIKATHDTSGDMAPLLEIDHIYYQEAILIDDGTYHHVVTGWITLTNKGGSNLENISIFINLGNEAVIHQPFICDAHGTPASDTLSFPNLPAGQTSPAQAYYWSLINHEPGAQEPVPFTVTPRLTPQYTVSYTTLPTFSQHDTTTVNLS
ncbi:MAG TPA: hypothetical protein VGS07_33330 [Thermoanaerobaculia bacterium]|jgi:hypothetical protein|nr:hypothetical protein [Thermoanaerobaculia bacterium]